MHLTCMCISSTCLSLESKTLLRKEISNFVTKKINASKVLDGDRDIANAPSGVEYLNNIKIVFGNNEN